MLLWLLVADQSPEIMSRDTQDEAALRLVDASPDSGEYRPISFVVNFYSGLFVSSSSEFLIG